MKSILSVLVILIGMNFSYAKNMALIGKIPGKYLGKKSKKAYLGAIKVHYDENGRGFIQDIYPITSGPSEEKKLKEYDVWILKSGRSYDVIYPGFIDLHNHTKQNFFSEWFRAKGRFANRFEWRDLGKKYDGVVKGNYKPWLKGAVAECASHRWSELQAMTHGTLYLQGHISRSNCINDYSIYQVESNLSYVTEKMNVKASTDIIYSDEMSFVYNELKPYIVKHKSYDKGLLHYLYEYCPAIKPSLQSINSTIHTDALKILSDRKTIESICKEDKFKNGEYPQYFVRYMTIIHKGISGRIKYTKEENMSGVIGHLAEGRRLDTYNNIEFKLLELLDLVTSGVNLVHGVAFTKNEFEKMAKNNMGLIWSPYSNLLLYSETADIKAAIEAGVTLSLGSDWSPTGSKGILDEVKIAKDYILEKKLNNLITDEDLVNMMTENPAKMIGHYKTVNSKERGIGSLNIGSMASFVVTKNKITKDAYLNLTDSEKGVYSNDISLVLIDGKPIYGKKSLFEKKNFEDSQLEVISNKFLTKNNTEKIQVPNPLLGITSSKEQYDYMVALSKKASEKLKFSNVNSCENLTTDPLVMVKVNSNVDYISKFSLESGLNLDRFEDIYKFLASHVFNATYNNWGHKDGDEKFIPDYFPPLISCQDKKYISNLKNYIKEVLNENESKYITNREEWNLGSKPKALAEKYGKEYIDHQ